MLIDRSFEEDVDSEDKIITKQEYKNLYYLKTKMTKVLKLDVELEWFNNKQIFHLHSIHGITHDYHLAYMHACHLVIIHCV